MVKVLNGTLADSIAIMMNVSLNTSISGSEVVDIFESGHVKLQWEQHICKLYNEFSLGMIKAFTSEYNISKGKFVSVHSSLPEYCQNYDFTELLKQVY